MPRIGVLFLFLGFFACTPKNGVETGSTSTAISPANIEIDRGRETPGFIPEYTWERLPNHAEAYFPKSRYERPMDMLEVDAKNPPHKRSDVRIIYPNKGCSSWEECGLNDPSVRYFLITPGDYVGWGTLELTESGTEQNRRILRYYNPALANPYEPEHPVKMAGNAKKEVVLESLRMIGTDYWVFHGLSFRGRASTKKGHTGGKVNQIGYEADHNIINFCLFEKFVGAGAMRIFQSNYNTVQNCVIRDKGADIGVDIGGIGISAFWQKEARGNRIVNNEIYNVTDAVGLVYNVNKKGNKERAQMGSVPGTIIENNDFYIEPSMYSYKGDEEWSCAEDGLDFKTGTKSLKAADRVQIINNRIWGHRPTDQTCGGSGSTGSGIVIHRDASNMLIKGNIIFDVAQGVSIFGKNKKYPEEMVENIALVNNLFYDMRDVIDGNFNSGLAMKLTSSVDVYYNTVVNARQLLYVHERNSTHRFQCNTFVNIDEAFEFSKNRQSWSSMNAWINYPDAQRIYAHQGTNNTILAGADKKDFADFTFYRRRWTGPEKVVLPKAILRKGHGLSVQPEQNCHCADGGEGGRWWTR